MQKFRVLYLRHNKLEHSESLTGLDLLEVIEKASKRVPDLSAEIWSERGKVGIVEPRRSKVSASADTPNLARFTLLGGDVKLRPDTRLVDERVIQTCKLEVDFGNLLTIGC